MIFVIITTEETIMGRELRRKQAKREGKNLARENLENEHQIKKLLIITGLILFIAIIIYLLTATFITKELKWFSSCFLVFKDCDSLLSP